MTVALDDVVMPAEYLDIAEVRSADWPARAGAFCIDVVFGVGALFSLLLIGWSAPWGGLLWWVSLGLAGLLLTAIGINRLVAPVITGWTLGRSVFGIAVVDRDGRRPDSWRLLLREVAHLLDTLPLFLGWLWPLIDGRGRTFADILAQTEVRRVDGPRPDLRRPAAAAVAAAAALAVTGAGLGYLGVYRPQQAVAEVREQIADEGPGIVVDMLSYTTQTMEDDFARAQSLVTEEYRAEVIAEQASVRKAGPVDNDYWVNNSAVLSASPGQATMLMLLQGQRGTGPQQRFLSASVRVDFEKPGEVWKVAMLRVLTPSRSSPPAPAGPEPDEAGAKPPASATAEPAPASPPPSAGGR